jgi:hypothetical protein
MGRCRGRKKARRKESEREELRRFSVLETAVDFASAGLLRTGDFFAAGGGFFRFYRHKEDA